MVQRRGHARSQRPGRNQPKLPVRVVADTHIAHCHVRTNVQTKYWFPRNDIIKKCYFLLISSNFEFNRRLCLHPEVHLPRKCDNLNSAHLSSSDLSPFAILRNDSCNYCIEAM